MRKSRLDIEHVRHRQCYQRRDGSARYRARVWRVLADEYAAKTSHMHDE